MTKEKLIDYLIEKEIPDNLDPKEESKIVSEIFKHSWDITPENLYRFRNCNSYSFDALENDKFLLTKPTLFNDPYDSLLYIDREKILDVISKPDDNNDLIGRLNTDLEFRVSQINLLGKDFVDKFIKNNSFKNAEEKEFYKKLSNLHYIKVIDEIIDESLKSLKQSSLVACLSERIDSILMWSHYAQNHQGFALNYDFKSRFSIDLGFSGVRGTDFADKKILPVRYSNERFDATYYVEFHFIDNYYKSLGLKFNAPFYDKLFYYKILLFKSLDWSYEKEWRIIKQTNLDYEDNKSDFDFINHIKPKEIHLGSQISKENKQRLIEIGKEKNIQVCQMKLQTFSKEYKLISEKI